MDPFSRPGTSSSIGTASGGTGGSDHGGTDASYELENSVSEIFRLLKYKSIQTLIYNW